ncbi:hypothetical protein V2A60_007562 [Cordyceps javanica]
MGSIQNHSFRSAMATLFHDERASRWWLSGDKGFTPMLQSLRNFADERQHNAVANGQPNYGQVMGRLFHRFNFEGDLEQ